MCILLCQRLHARARTKAFPALAELLQPLYFERGERIGRAFYLPTEIRREIIRKIKSRRN